MTVIRPNSISGVTSITALANEINVFKHDGVLAGLQLNGVNHHTISGVSTFHTLNVLGNVSVGGTLTYEDVTNIDSVGIITAQTGIKVLAGGINAVGVVTATSLTINDYIYHHGDTNTFIGFESNDTIRFNTNGSDKLKINSSGHLILADDNDTYIHHPAADSLAITTGGSERLRIKSDGNVGIGTDNPTKLLELFGTDPTIKLMDSSGDAYALIEGDSADQGSIRFRADPLGAGSGTHIRFDTDGTERLRIKSDGALSLTSENTTGWILKAGQDTSSYSVIDNHFATTNRTLYLNQETTHRSFVVWNKNGSDGYGFGLDSSGNFKVVYSTNERLRITSGGLLQLNNDAAKIQLGASQDLSIYHNGSSNRIIAANADLIVQSQNYAIRSENGSTTYLNIKSNGAIALPDGTQGIRFGSAASEDFAIYHSGANSHIDHFGDGNLYHDFSNDFYMRFYQSAGVVRTALYISNGGSSNPEFQLRSNPTNAPTNSGTHSPAVRFRGAGWNTNSGSVEVGTILQSEHYYWQSSASNVFGQTYPDFKIKMKNSDNGSYVSKFRFSGNGNAAFNGSLTQNSSDIRLKENIQPITNSLEKVESLSGFTYNWNKTAQDLGFKGGGNDELQVGLSAQDVEKIQPEVVKPAPVDNTYKTIQYEKLVPLLVEAIKELKAKNETLETKVAALEGS